MLSLSTLFVDNKEMEGVEYKCTLTIIIIRLLLSEGNSFYCGDVPQIVRDFLPTIFFLKILL